MVDLPGMMEALAGRRRLFHSEKDFQHALAWQVQLTERDARIRLESQPLPKTHLDILVALEGKQVAIEVKYLVKRCRTIVDGEKFALSNQGAHDASRYDVLKDAVRLEKLVASDRADEGWALTLSNDPAYWRPGLRTDTVDAAFRIHEGRTITDPLEWADHAGKGTTKGRQAPLESRGCYPCRWRAFAVLDDEDGRQVELRYLALRIQPPQPVSSVAGAAPESLV